MKTRKLNELQQSIFDMPVECEIILPENDNGFNNVISLSKYQYQSNQINPARVYISSLSIKSQRTMTNALDDIARIITNGNCNAFDCPWHLVNFQIAQCVHSVLACTNSASTANLKQAAFRMVVKTCVDLEIMDANVLYKILNVTPGISGGEYIPAGRHITVEELFLMEGVCDNDNKPQGTRDGSIISFFYETGLRRTEIRNLNLNDIDLKTGEVVIRKGKGNKDRITYLPLDGHAMPRLKKWLSIRGDHEGALFHPVNKGGRILFESMTDQAIYNMIKKRAKEAGIQEISPCDFRRTFIGNLFTLGTDLSTIMQLVGHKNCETTQRYDRRDLNKRKEAAKTINKIYKIC